VPRSREARLREAKRRLEEELQVERHHHRRIVRGAPVTVGAIGGVERGQIERRDRVDDKPRQVILRQPLAQAGRQQQLLLAITRQEVLRHARIVLTAPDRPTLSVTGLNECGTRGLTASDAVRRSLQAKQQSQFVASRSRWR
jgi:hypothetical protein